MNEEFDKLKTKVLKYILYKKRTEKEVLQKFAGEDENLLEEVILYLKEAKYINDNQYIEKAVNEFVKLKNLSIKELEYKLLSKGLKREIIAEYIYANKEELIEYERKSAQNIICKKKNSCEMEEIENYLRRKGYLPEIIKIAVEEL